MTAFFNQPTYKTCKWVSIVSLFFGFFNVGNLALAATSSHNFEHPWKILQEQRANILRLSSDDEALQFNSQFMPSSQTLRPPVHRDHSSKQKQTPHPLPDKIQSATTTLWAALATIGYTQEFRIAIASPSDRHIHVKPTKPQLQWVLSKPSLEEFQHLMSFYSKLLERSHPQPPAAHPADSNFSKFSIFLEHWISTDLEQRGIDRFQKEGFKGIHIQVQEQWQNSENKTNSDSVSDELQQSYFQYVEIRLLPLLHTHFLKQAMKVEAHLYDIAWQSWEHIQQWQQQKEFMQAARRLCGTWKWIIHNHQNHRDIKTTMTFTSPENSSPSEIQPSAIRVHGDTVYLKWTFSQGFQEDSLLFSNRDARLEGTFTNSHGPYGSISAQRLSSCED